jgi:diaminopimelate epimerase
MGNQFISFIKMHGLGNDILILDLCEQSINLSQLPIQALAHRHTGIGFDQLMTVEPIRHGHFFCRIFNADGSEAKQCGNGLRCVASYLFDHHIHTDTHLTLETKAGIFPIEIQKDKQIRVSIHAPHIKHPLLPITLLNQTISISVVEIGNPHAILRVDSLDQPPLNELALQLSTQSQFPCGVNLGLMKILTPHHIQLRTFERGVGETLACGSNACAAVASGIMNGWLERYAKVDFKYGSLLIEWDNHSHPLYMTGPATQVYAGHFSLSKE